ncbi:hypothetical protein GCM10010512_31710 [Streptomyces thermoviolaceus subsp. thermoviolaceus]|nr:hypothetical protein GCM10010499_01700 [Streptomyces thermoviolaceus subsp. apingens]GHA97870.1 hypothetical protein GCM10010512_31710 [Streptomyces thermoviolaceus subsp. thermoviolaceus]
MSRARRCAVPAGGAAGLHRHPGPSCGRPPRTGRDRPEGVVRTGDPSRGRRPACLPRTDRRTGPAAPSGQPGEAARTASQAPSDDCRTENPYTVSERYT